MAKIIDLAHKRKRKPSIIKAGSYDDLPSHLQRAVDGVKEKASRPVPHKVFGSGVNLQQRIKNILLGR